MQEVGGWLPRENEVRSTGSRAMDRSREPISSRISTGSIRSPRPLLSGAFFHGRHPRYNHQGQDPVLNPISRDRMSNHKGNLPPLRGPPVQQVCHRHDRHLDTTHDLNLPLDHRNPTSTSHNQICPPGPVRPPTVPPPSLRHLRLINS